MRAVLILVLLFWSLPARAQQTLGLEVDLELVLLVDVSRSMSPIELEIQRTGYAAALRSDAVWGAVQSGLLQTIALTYVEWAGTQETIVPWRVIASRADLDAFADALTVRDDPRLRRTSITNALDHGRSLIERNSYSGLRRVIDISGDGPNNQGGLVTEARDRVLAAGITINGLPLMTQDGMGADWGLDRLDIYYETCVIGGPASFVLPVWTWEDFPAAVRRKLVLEIAGLAPAPRVIPALTRDPRDCLVGEKIWEDRRRYWEEP